MSEHKQEHPRNPIDADELKELVDDCELIVAERAHESFLRLEAMKVIHLVEEGELKAGSIPDEETLEVMSFLGWFDEG